MYSTRMWNCGRRTQCRNFRFPLAHEPLVDELQVSLSPMALVAAGTPELELNPPSRQAPAARGLSTNAVREVGEGPSSMKAFAVQFRLAATDLVHEVADRVMPPPGSESNSGELNAVKMAPVISDHPASGVFAVWASRTNPAGNGGEANRHGSSTRGWWSHRPTLRSRLFRIVHEQKAPCRHSPRPAAFHAHRSAATTTACRSPTPEDRNARRSQRRDRRAVPPGYDGVGVGKLA